MNPTQLQQDAQKLLPYIEAISKGKSVDRAYTPGYWNSVKSIASLQTYVRDGLCELRIAPEQPDPTAEDYLIGHKLSGLKVGDKVRVLRVPELGERGWNSGPGVSEYCSKMIGGHEFKIYGDHDVLGFAIDTFDSNCIYLPHFVLSKVTPKLRDMRKDDFDGMPVIWVRVKNGKLDFIVNRVGELGLKCEQTDYTWAELRESGLTYTTTRLKDDWHKFEREET